MTKSYSNANHGNNDKNYNERKYRHAIKISFMRFLLKGILNNTGNDGLRETIQLVDSIVTGLFKERFIVKFGALRWRQVNLAVVLIRHLFYTLSLFGHRLLHT